MDWKEALLLGFSIGAMIAFMLNAFCFVEEFINKYERFKPKRSKKLKTEEMMEEKKELPVEDGTAKGASHYQQAEIEPIEVMQDYFTAEMMHGFCLGNVIKYALRARFKGTELKDIEKMEQYAKWDVQVMKAEWIDPRKG